MAEPLTLTQLNRIYLHRQWLTQRRAASPVEAMEHLVGLQAQIPNPPYIGLWTRLQDFEKAALSQLIESGAVVRAAMLRFTLHLYTAQDHQRVQATLQPALERYFRSYNGKEGKALDTPKVVAAARAAYGEVGALATGELKKELVGRYGEANPDVLANAVRAYLPLVQLPPGGLWGSPSRVPYLPAESVINQPAAHADLRGLLRRYLAAFGPANVMDFQTWTGMTKLKNELQPLLDELVAVETDDGQTLYDLPDMPPAPDETPPVRFIPEYDNLLIGHQDRRRIIADEHRQHVFLSAARVASTILVDGFVAGRWKIASEKGTATLTIEPFIALSAQAESDLHDEGLKLLKFAEEDAVDYAVEITKPL